MRMREMAMPGLIWSEFDSDLTGKRKSCSVVEVPAQSETEDASVKRIVRCQEILLAAASSVYVAHHYEEASAFEVEVGVCVDYRIVAGLYA